MYVRASVSGNFSFLAAALHWRGFPHFEVSDAMEF